MNKGQFKEFLLDNELLMSLVKITWEIPLQTKSKTILAASYKVALTLFAWKYLINIYV